MDKIEEIVNMGEDETENLQLRNFIDKRSALQQETMRDLSQMCVKACAKYAEKREEKKMKYLSHEEEMDDYEGCEINLTANEMQCMNKCADKVVKINSIIERHLSEAFNPSFVSKFMWPTPIYL